MNVFEMHFCVMHAEKNKEGEKKIVSLFVCVFQTCVAENETGKMCKTKIYVQCVLSLSFFFVCVC